MNIKLKRLIVFLLLFATIAYFFSKTGANISLEPQVLPGLIVWFVISAIFSLGLAFLIVWLWSSEEKPYPNPSKFSKWLGLDIYPKRIFFFLLTPIIIFILIWIYLSSIDIPCDEGVCFYLVLFLAFATMILELITLIITIIWYVLKRESRKNNVDEQR